MNTGNEQTDKWTQPKKHNLSSEVILGFQLKTALRYKLSTLTIWRTFNNPPFDIGHKKVLRMFSTFFANQDQTIFVVIITGMSEFSIEINLCHFVRTPHTNQYFIFSSAWHFTLFTEAEYDILMDIKPRKDDEQIFYWEINGKFTRVCEIPQHGNTLLYTWLVCEIFYTFVVNVTTWGLWPPLVENSCSYF